jgi:hypothetical protein
MTPGQRIVLHVPDRAPQPGSVVRVRETEVGELCRVLLDNGAIHDPVFPDEMAPETAVPCGEVMR